MTSFSIEDEQESDRLASLSVVLPLAVVGFVVAAGCWTLFAAAGTHFRHILAVGTVEFGLLLAMPMAAGALFALPAGVAAQKAGARRVMIVCLSALAVCMALTLLVESWAGYLLVASGLGFAGGFYSAGIQFVASHTPYRYRGLVLGTFGAGLAGAGLNYFLVPLLMQAFSWRAVPLAYLLVLVLVVVLLVLLTANDEPSDHPAAAARNSGWRSGHLQDPGLCLHFGIVAGSFFALALWLPDFMSTNFSLTMASGAHVAAWFVIPGALAQIAGGWLADRYGSALIVRSLIACLVALFILSYPPMTLSVRGIESVIAVDFALPLWLEGFFIVLLGLSLGATMGGLQCMVVSSNQNGAAFAAGMLLFSACLAAFLLSVVFGLVIHWAGVGSAIFVIVFVVLASGVWWLARDRRREERQALINRGI
jgi:NNP family nitrate/nitrite transporter-like MFS transporter